MKKLSFRLIYVLTAALIAEVAAPTLLGVAQAAPPPQFTQGFLRLNRHKALTPTGGTICVTPSTTSTIYGTFEITFPTQTGTDFVVNATAANWTVSTTNLPAGATAWVGIGTATNVTGHTVRFPSGNLAAATQYCFNFSGTNTLTNGAAGPSLIGTMNAKDNTATPAIINATNYATAVIADDQIVVNAVVPPNFIFSLGGNTDSFISNLDPLNIVSTTGVTFSIITNAKSGWIAWAKDSQQGLFSATANYKINTSGTVDGAPSTLVANGSTEGYVLDSKLITDAAGGCTVAIDPEYNGVGTTQGGTLSANFQPVAACTGAPPATSNGDTVKLIERATIAGGTPAGSDYTDVVTVVAAGNF